MLSFKTVLLALAVASGVVVQGGPTAAEKNTGDGLAVSGPGVVPANVTEPAVVPLAGPGVYVTTAIDFSGASLYVANVNKGQCYSFDPSWQGVVSSFGPDPGLKCYGYQKSDCQPPSPNFGPIYNPGVSSVPAWEQDGINWNDLVNSFKCWSA
ncbi:hypothetical protein AURDEDRAFT_167302 [Auricularia subglabra TFB-10046 SS5]|nr:hypothetical protein AURDEDRAFT_167302 [Auricularia subglabra TFB-10046 SS5]